MNLPEVAPVKKAVRITEGASFRSAETISFLTDSEEKLQEQDKEGLRKEIGDLADLPASHPARLEIERLRREVKERKEAEEKASAPRVIKNPKHVSSAEKRKAEQERERILSERAKDVKELNQTIDGIVMSMRILLDKTSNIRAKHAGQSAYLNFSVARLELVAMALHRGLLDNRLQENRIERGE